MECHPIAARFPVAARDLHAAPLGLLIDERRLEADFTVADVEQEIASIVYTNGLRALERELDDVRIRARRDDEVVFELLLIAVVDEVHSGIDVLVFDCPVAWNLRVPVSAIAADDVVALSGQFVVLRDARCRVAVNQLHPQRRRHGALGRFRRSPAQRQNSFGRREE